MFLAKGARFYCFVILEQTENPSYTYKCSGGVGSHCMCCTSQVQIWQGSLAGWKLSPGPYTLPSNMQSAQKHISSQRLSITYTPRRSMPDTSYVCLPAQTGQHSPGTLMKLRQGDRQRTSEQVVTPSTHIHVIQGVESANQLLPSPCSSPPYMQPESKD